MVDPVSAFAAPMLERMRQAVDASHQGLAREFTDSLEQLADAAVDNGFAGLHDVCHYTLEVIARLESEPLDPAWRTRLKDWIERVEDYVDTPSSTAAVNEVLAVIESPPAGEPIDLEHIEVLRAMLRMPDGSLPGGESSELDFPGFESDEHDPQDSEGGGVATEVMETGDSLGFAFDLDLGSEDGSLAAEPGAGDTYTDFTRAAFGESTGARTTSTGRISALEDLDAARKEREAARDSQTDTTHLGTDFFEFTLDTTGRVDVDGLSFSKELAGLHEQTPVDRSDPDAVTEALSRAESCLDQLSIRAAELGQLSLHDIIALTQDVISKAATTGGEHARSVLESFEHWPDLLENQLLHPSSRNWEALTGWLSNPAHDVVLESHELGVLTEMFESETMTGTHFSLELPHVDYSQNAALSPDAPRTGALQAPDSVPEPGGLQPQESNARPPVSEAHDDSDARDSVPDAAAPVGDARADAQAPAPRAGATSATGEREHAESDAYARVEEDPYVRDEEGTHGRRHPGDTHRVTGSAHSMQALELMSLLGGEYEQLRKDLEAGVETDPAAAALRFDDALERFASACDVAGLPGLAHVCGHLRNNIATGTTLGDGPAGELAARLTRANSLVLTYLEEPADHARADRLVAALREREWPVPLGPDEAQALLASLGSPALEEGIEAPAARAQLATGELASLELPPDVNPELIESLLQELPVQTEAFSGAVQKLLAGGGEHGVAHQLDVAQRVAHTLKGAGNTVGVAGIANLTHHLEDILLGLRKAQSRPSAAVGETLMTAADCLEGIGEYLAGAGPYPDDVQLVMQSVLDWANRADREGIAALAQDDDGALETADQDAAASGFVPGRAAAPVAPREDEAAVADGEVPAPPSAVSRGVEAAGLSHDEGDPAIAGQMVRVPAGMVDNLLRLVGETIILTGQVHERLRRSREHNEAMQAQLEMLRLLGGELEAHIDLADMSGPSRRLRLVDATHDTAVQNGEFDPLEMDEYNELHTISRQLVEAATDARELGHIHFEQLVALDGMLVTQDRLNRETQEAVLRTRMVPVKNILPRLQRAVRQTCRQTAKQVEVDFSGGDTLMDSDVLNNIVDPLMHLLRNAIDHGIEKPEVREASGKPRVGNLRLEFARDGSQVAVRCTDDGAGIDYEAARARARAMGLIGDGAGVSHEELKRLLFRSNFTTRDDVTHVSGRGVGLDAVYSRVVELGGSIELHSEPGHHCTVDIRLPVTLISTHALLVSAGEQTLALANRGVEQIVHAQSGELMQAGNQLMFKLDDDAFPARSLESVLGVDATGRVPLSQRPIVLVRGEAGLSAVLPEAVVGSRDLVVKGLGPYVPKLRGIIGVTILGDGSVTAVVDLPELLRGPARESAVPASDTGVAAPEGPVGAMPSVLVVDDSLSARRSLAQVMRDYGYDVRTARDGIEAVNEIALKTPDLLLTDMEMPRMNGIELARHTRGRPESKDVPVVMLTSRATQRHRDQAHAAGVDVYLTKPFSEEQVIGHVETLLGIEPRRAAG